MGDHVAIVVVEDSLEKGVRLPEGGKDEGCAELLCCDLNPFAACYGPVQKRERAARRLERKLVLGVELTFTVLMWRGVVQGGEGTQNLDLAISSSVFWLLGLWLWFTSMRPKAASKYCWKAFGCLPGICKCENGGENLCCVWSSPEWFDDEDDATQRSRTAAVFFDLLLEEVPMIVISALFLSRDEDASRVTLFFGVLNIVANFAMAWYHMALVFAAITVDTVDDEDNDFEGCSEHCFLGVLTCGSAHFGAWLGRREKRRKK